MDILSSIRNILYHLYKFRGYKCRYLIYNDSIPIAESARARRFELIKQKLSDTFDFGSFILTAAKVNFEIIPYTAVLEISEEQTLEELIAIKKFNVPIGEIALSAAFPFTQRTSLNEEIKPYLVQFLKLAYSNVTYFEETLRLRRPHTVFLSHGIYATWGGVALCKQNGIDFVCYDRAKTINTVNFNKGQPAPDWKLGVLWMNRNYELSCKQSEWVEKDLLVVDYKPTKSLITIYSTS